MLQEQLCIQSSPDPRTPNLSTGFLVGPVRQIKFMFHPKRWLTSLVVIGALIGTLLVAILVRLTVT